MKSRVVSKYGSVRVDGEDGGQDLSNEKSDKYFVKECLFEYYSARDDHA